MDQELRIDRTRCDGHGLCAELLPELVRVDDWGYPIIAPGPVPAQLADHARRAVASCPVLALRLQRSQQTHRLDPAASQGPRRS
ncbi:MAG TPA: ferredoxin [Candidatus Dormibacteraeota bacterium]|nr:ferredoxin [Candidatus Dormibacteraeota bacterium]